MHPLAPSEAEVESNPGGVVLHHAQGESVVVVQIAEMQVGEPRRDVAVVAEERQVERPVQFHPIFCLQQHDIEIAEPVIRETAQRRLRFVAPDHRILIRVKRSGSAERLHHVERHARAALGTGRRRPRVQRNAPTWFRQLDSMNRFQLESIE